MAARSKKSRKSNASSKHLLFSVDYYGEYHGHDIRHLKRVHKTLREFHTNSPSTDSAEAKQSPVAIFLAGDSSLDNKYWFLAQGGAGFHRLNRSSGSPSARVSAKAKAEADRDRATAASATTSSASAAGMTRVHTHLSQTRAVDEEEMYTTVGAEPLNGYELVLSDLMAKDVCYWVNFELTRRFSHGSGANNGAVDQPSGVFCVNCAVEESTVGMRTRRLLPHDEFIRDHIQDGDILVISVGGNDVALRPTAMTILSMAGLAFCTPQSYIERHKSGLGMNHFKKLLQNGVISYIRRVVGSNKPRAIAVCTIYYPCTESGGSWADTTLGLLGYNRSPGKLQAIIRAIHSTCVESVQDVDGIPVVPVPLFDLLDPDDPRDYRERVEPSIRGGHKMARGIVDALSSHLPAWTRPMPSPPPAPVPAVGVTHKS